MNKSAQAEGILLVDKPQGWTSFRLVAELRRRLGVRTIGHAGTLDPLATGLMVMLVGRRYTRLSNQFLQNDKEYIATLHLGVTTDSYDAQGQILSRNETIPTLQEVELALPQFQGQISQIPPMFSAKKREGKKLYELARQGKTVDRPPCLITVAIELLDYTYPHLTLKVSCSKGTYVRSLAQDLGQVLTCGAHLSALRRTRSGALRVESAILGTELHSPLLEECLSRHTLQVFP